MTLPPLVFVLGCPGVGKSAVVRHLLGGGGGGSVGRWTLGEDAGEGRPFCALGPYEDGVHDGADALPLSDAVLAKAFGQLDDEAGLLASTAIVDGVRIGRPMLETARAATARAFMAVVLEAPLSTIRERRRARGSPDVSDDWLLGERERAVRLAGEVAAHERDAGRAGVQVFISAQADVARVAEAVCDALRSELASVEEDVDRALGLSGAPPTASAPVLGYRTITKGGGA